MSLDFSWKDETASSKNIRVEELPLPAIPAQRTVITEIDGRDGNIIETLGYAAYEKVIKIALPRSGYNMEEIADWLQGSGDLILSNEDSFYYKAHIVKPTDFTRLLRFRRASVAFLVQPWKYATNETVVTASAAQLGAKALSVTNLGFARSLPLITLTGSGAVTLSVGGASVCTLALGATAQTVYVDAAEMEAYSFAAGVRVLKNDIMTGNFPQLAAGANTISWTGTVTAIVVTPQSRWL